MKRQNRDGLRKICGCPARTWPKCQHSCGTSPTGTVASGTAFRSTDMSGGT